MVCSLLRLNASGVVKCDIVPRDAGRRDMTEEKGCHCFINPSILSLKPAILSKLSKALSRDRLAKPALMQEIKPRFLVACTRNIILVRPLVICQSVGRSVNLLVRNNPEF